MKTSSIAALAALWAQQAAAHAIFQDLWVDGVDYGSQCARLPSSNSPVTDVTSTSLRCNVGTTRPGAKCPVKAGSTVTVEMHQVASSQPTFPYTTNTPRSNPATAPAPPKPSAAPTTAQ